MRLSKHIKEVIQNNWENEKHLNIQQKLRDSLEGELRSLFEKEYKDQIAVFNDNPDISKYILTYDHFKCDLTRNLEFTSRTAIPCGKYASERRYEAEKLTCTNAVKSVIKCHKDKYDSYKDERNAILDVMDSVTTVKKLLELLPEIEKYVPKTSSATTLVAAENLAKVKELL